MVCIKLRKLRKIGDHHKTPASYPSSCTLSTSLRPWLVASASNSLKKQVKGSPSLPGNLGTLSERGLSIATMPDCAFDIVSAACGIMGWDGAVERVVSAHTGVEVEGMRGVAAVAATGGMGVETGGHRR